jgi:hypothetical protein
MENGSVYLDQILAGPTKWAGLLWREAKHEAGDRCAHVALAPATPFPACWRRGRWGGRYEHDGGALKWFEGSAGNEAHRRACPRWQQVGGVQQQRQRGQDVVAAARLARESRWTTSMLCKDEAALVLCQNWRLSTKRPHGGSGQRVRRSGWVGRIAWAAAAAKRAAAAAACSSSSKLCAQVAAAAAAPVGSTG